MLFVGLIFTIGFFLVPQEAKNRVQESFGDTMESGTADRLSRIDDAIKIIQDNPWYGSGWGAAGLAHNDWLQIWADAGLFMMLAFLWLFVKIISRLKRFSDSAVPSHYKHFSRALIASSVALMLIIAFEPLFNLPEQYPPFWTILGLAYIYPDMIRRELAVRAQRGAPA